MPVISATLEAEIRRTAVPGQPEQKVPKIPSQQKRLGVVVLTCHPSYRRKHK
jgi:hypothetical protein